MTTVFCKDCVHFEYRESVCAPMMGIYIPPAALCRRERSPVFGTPIDADFVRMHSLLCGHEGRWFEQKPPDPPPLRRRGILSWLGKGSK